MEKSKLMNIVGTVFKKIRNCWKNLLLNWYVILFQILKYTSTFDSYYYIQVA